MSPDNGGDWLTATTRVIAAWMVATSFALVGLIAVDLGLAFLRRRRG